MILQLDPPLHLQTPKGPGWAHMLVDYGPEHHSIWVVFLDDGGACWWVPNPEVKLSPNWTMGRRCGAKSYYEVLQRGPPA